MEKVTDENLTGNLDKLEEKSILKQKVYHQASKWLHKQNAMVKIITLFKLMNSKYTTSNIESLDSVQCPKTRAVKLLFAEFLMQHELLFTLFTFGTEVPSLYSISEFSQYVSQFTQVHQYSEHCDKMHFMKSDVLDILQALGFNPTCHLVQYIQSSYEKQEVNTSLLACIIETMVAVMDKFCLQEVELKTLKKKEEHFHEIIEKQKSTIDQFQIRFQEHENMLTQYKEYIRKKILDRELYLNKLNSHLEQRETELSNKQKCLQEKEQEMEYQKIRWEETKNNETVELEKRITDIKNQHEELQNIRESLLNEEKLLKRREELSHSVEEKLSDSIKKELTEKYEKKMHFLQSELLQIREKFMEDEIRFKKYLHTDDTKTTGKTTCDRSTQCTAKEFDHFVNRGALIDFLKVQQELHLERNHQKHLEKQLNQLKVVWEDRNLSMNNIVSELSHLRNSLQYLTTEVLNMKKDPHSNKEKAVVKNSSTPLRDAYHEITGKNSEIKNLEHSARKSYPILTSASNSKDSSSLTDDIVSDAKEKLKELEKESESLNRNFQNLQNIIARNLSRDSDKVRSSWTTRSLPSPRCTEKLKRYHLSCTCNHCEDFSECDQGSDKNFHLDQSSYSRGGRSLDRSPFPGFRRVSPFRQLFLKYRRQKTENVDSSTDSGSKLSFGKKPKCAKTLFPNKNNAARSVSSDSLPEYTTGHLTEKNVNNGAVKKKRTSEFGTCMNVETKENLAVRCMDLMGDNNFSALVKKSENAALTDDSRNDGLIDNYCMVDVGHVDRCNKREGIDEIQNNNQPIIETIEISNTIKSSKTEISFTKLEVDDEPCKDAKTNNTGQNNLIQSVSPPEDARKYNLENASKCSSSPGHIPDNSGSSSDFWK